LGHHFIANVGLGLEQQGELPGITLLPPSAPAHPDLPPAQKLKLLRQILFATSLFAVFELTVAAWSQSLTLMAESGHILSDMAALGVSLLATWLAQRPGHHKAVFWAALSNSLGLVLLAAWVAIEAIARLQQTSPEVLGLPMLGTAVVGLGVNSVNCFWLYRSRHQDLNLQGAFLHVLADALGSVGAILAAIAITWLGWTWADTWISLLISGLIFLSALPLMGKSLRSLREQTPPTDLAPACGCPHHGLEKLLFPSLTEQIR
jgi:cobalt-zinc-cadmium efflux system protein